VSIALYIASTTPYAGKNTLSIGLVRYFAQAGYTPAWHKPLGNLPIGTPNGPEDEDTLFMRGALGLDGDAVPPSSVLVTQDLRMRTYRGETVDPIPALRDLYASLGRRHDALVVSGADMPESGAMYGLDGLRFIRELGFKALLVDRVTHDAHPDHLLHMRGLIGDALAGVVFNAVGPAMRAHITDEIQPFLEKRGIPVLGSIPQDPQLASLQVSQIMERLDARLLTSAGKTARAVERFLIGTMQVENFMAHFRRSPQSAVIVGGDRSDVQMAAIEGGSPCLVLTGSFHPGEMILSRADALNVPVLLTADDTFRAARKVESLFSAGAIRDAGKVARAEKLVLSSLDFTALRQALER
jgi:BioD-like phosphotransacetylase family protein